MIRLTITNEHRDVICQLRPEAGQRFYMGARFKRAAYGLNYAPRLWWNRLDRSLRSYGLVPTRVDRCCYVLYKEVPSTRKSVNFATPEASSRCYDSAIWEASSGRMAREETL